MPVPTEELKVWIDKLDRRQDAFQEKYHAEQTALREEIHALRAETSDALGDIRVQFSELRSEIRTGIGILKWGGGIVGTLAIAGLLNSLFWAGTMSAEIRHLDKEFQVMNERINKGLIEVIQRTPKTPDNHFDLPDAPVPPR